MTVMTTEQGFELFLKALTGNNFSKETVRAYRSDLQQFIEYLQTCRVDWNNPVRISRVDIVEFMNHLHTVSRSGTTRARKLASIRHFLSFLKENDVIAGNPAEKMSTKPFCLRHRTIPGTLQSS
jgi:site-specific recombinase XerD